MTDATDETLVPEMDLTRWGFPADAVAVVTGAGSGIGRATARALGSIGVAVSCWDLVEATAESIAAELTDRGASANAVACDVTDPEAVAASFDVAASLGSVGHLVNNAGPASSAPYSYTDALVMAAGSMESCSQAFVDTDPGPGSSIVNVASVAGNRVGAEPAWYASSKAAIAGLTRTLALRHGSWLRTNAVAPSLVNTPRMERYTGTGLGEEMRDRNPMGRWAEADDVARAILFLLSPAASYVNGELLVVDGGQTLVL